MEVIEKDKNDININQKDNSNCNNTNIDDSIQMNVIKLNKNESDKKLEGLKKINEETTKYIEDMKKGTYNILVAVRCRPLSQKEKEISTYETINFIDKKVLVLKDPNGINNPNNNRSRENTMAFDFAFNQYDNQETIFNSTTKFLIEGVVNGFNATVFAYGATGAGKTYTMLGNEENPGIMPLTLKELFNKINYYSNREYTVKLWYLEIYNENIRDLLSNNDNYLDLREDPNKGIIVSGITELNASSSEKILNILKKGNKNRTTEATNANETSSRSHAILQILVSYKDKNSGIDYEIKYGKLSLIDLAGSERASVTQNRGIRLIEGANINRSLLTLGNCINALCEANEKGIKTYVPYRDSKLTRLLKDSLGGNARTVMIANVSPSINCFDDTYNTLNYANRAKKIKTNVKRNVLNAQYHITNYVNIIKNLQNRILDLENQIGKHRGHTVSPPTMRKDSNNIDNSFEKEIQKYTLRCFKDFDNVVEEVKKLCENEVKFKQKVMGNQIDIFNLMNKDFGNNKDVNGKIEENKNTLRSNFKNLKDTTNSIDNLIKKYNNNKFNSFEKDYINTIVKNYRNKIANFDLKFKLIIDKNQMEQKNSYIKELETQLQLRDNILSSKKILFEDLDNECKEKYKTLSQLKFEYTPKMNLTDLHNLTNNIIKETKKKNSEVINLTTIQNKTSYNKEITSNNSNLHLPPLSSGSINNTEMNNLNSMLQGIRDMNKNINDINSKIRNLEGVKNTKTYNAKEKDNIIVTKEKPKSRGGYSNNIGRINPSNNNFLNTPSRSNYNSNNFIKNFLPKNLNVNNNIPSSAKNNFRNRNREKDKEERERNSNPQTQYKRNKSLLIDQNSIDNNEQSDGNERINHFNNQSRITEEIEINSNNNIPFNNNSKDKSINEGHRKHRSLSQNKEFQNSDVDSSQINYKNKKLSPNNNKNQKKKIPFK
jgi:kinesin family protein 18/19